MSILPNLEKNAYLVVYIKDFYISAKLIYSDFQISRYYIQDSILEHTRIDQLTNSMFWKEYLANIEKELSWEIVHKGTGNIIHFGGEGIGLRGIEFVIDNRYFKNRVTDIVSSIRGCVLDAEIRFIDNSHIKEILEGVNKKLGYEDIVYLDLNIRDINMYRYRVLEEGGVLTQKRNIKEFSHGHINIGAFSGVVDRVFDSSFKAFSSIPFSSAKNINDWANYINNYGLYTPNRKIQDILRSYTLASILTIRNDNADKFNGLGDEKKKTLIVLSGSIVKNLDYKLLMLSVIDGLEIIGEVDVAFDNSFRVLPLSNNYLFGSLQSRYIVGKEDILSKVIKVIIPTKIDKKSSRKVMSDVNVESISQGIEKYFSMSDEITYINLPNESYVIDIRYKENTSVYDEDRYQYITSKDDIKYTHLMIDNRIRPVVYGPSYRENIIKINSWVNEEGTEINS